MQALRELSGAMPVPAVTSIVNAASFEPRLAPGAFATIFGANLANLTHEWNEAILDGKTLPTMLGGLQVRFNGQPGAVHFVTKDQANVIIPSDLPPGPVEVVVWSANGTWRGSATLQAAAPGLFGYFRETRFYPLALIAGTITRVAAPGVFSGVPSRPARPGDLIELYATGLGTLTDHPRCE